MPLTDICSKGQTADSPCNGGSRRHKSRAVAVVALAAGMLTCFCLFSFVVNFLPVSFSSPELVVAVLVII